MAQMTLARIVAAVGLAAACVAQSELPPAVLDLARIKEKMKDHLARMTNLTCLQTIERSRSDKTGRRVKDDILHLEVAFVEGKELFARMGAGKFEESDIGVFSKGGAVSSGVFASHARNVFVQKWPTFRYAGVELQGGRRAIRYDYAVPLMGSGYQMKIGGIRALVAYSGSFWADARTQEIMRLVVRADHIPPELRVNAAEQSIDYGRVVIGGAEFLLPQHAETSLTARSGLTSFNETEFSHWLQYVGESSLHFEEPAGGEAAGPAAPLRLPPGMVFSTQLTSQIRLEQAAVGDPIAAVVDQDARFKGEAVVPKGATLSGRIRMIERPDTASDNLTLVLEFSELAAGGRRTRFFARLVEVKSTTGVRKLPDSGVPGVGTLRVRQDQARLTNDLHLIWKMGEY